MPRKTRVEIRSLAPIASWLLTNCTGEQLSLLNRIASGSDFPAFVNLVSKLKDYNVYQVFRYKARDDRDLAEFRAGMVGEVVGLEALITICQAAKMEIERRKKSAAK